MRVRRDLAIAMMTCVSAAALQAQTGTWTNWRPDLSLRLGSAIVTDVARNRVLLFGGDASPPDGNTYAWDGREWIVVATSGPSPRSNPGLAYDAVRQRVVLYGGNNGGTELWEWDGSSWTQILPPGSRPGSIAGPAMAYDG